MTNPVYEPKGAAGEYAKLALNIGTGCTHGCTYCYVPAMVRKTKDDFHRGPHLKQNIVDRFKKHAHKYSGHEIFLCFTTDAFQKDHEVLETTRQILTIMQDNHVRPVFLTKGGRELLDFTYYFVSTNARIGMTLTCDNDIDSLKHEPKAAPTSERLEILEVMSKLGLETWVSFEPVIYPAQTLSLIRTVAGYVDFIFIGKLNHQESSTDWGAFREDVETLCQSCQVRFTIKKQLEAA